MSVSIGPGVPLHQGLWGGTFVYLDERGKCVMKSMSLIDENVNARMVK